MGSLYGGAFYAVTLQSPAAYRIDFTGHAPPLRFHWMYDLYIDNPLRYTLDLNSCRTGDWYKYAKTRERIQRNLPSRQPVGSLLSIAATHVGRNLTRETLCAVPADLHAFIQAYTPWRRQLGVYDAIRMWHPNGTLIREIGMIQISAPGRFRDGRPWVYHGAEIIWRHTGAAKRHTEYSLGRQHGAYCVWTPAGVPRVIAHYCDGERHGTLRRWLPAVGLVSETEYIRGEHQGYNRHYCSVTGYLVRDVERSIIFSPTQVIATAPSGSPTTPTATTATPATSATTASATEGAQSSRMITREWDRNGFLVGFGGADEFGRRNGFHIRIRPDRGEARVRYYRHGEQMLSTKMLSTTMLSVIMRTSPRLTELIDPTTASRDPLLYARRMPATEGPTDGYLVDETAIVELCDRVMSRPKFRRKITADRVCKNGRVI